MGIPSAGLLMICLAIVVSAALPLLPLGKPRTRVPILVVYLCGLLLFGFVAFRRERPVGDAVAMFLFFAGPAIIVVLFRLMVTAIAQVARRQLSEHKRRVCENLGIQRMVDKRDPMDRHSGDGSAARGR